MSSIIKFRQKKDKIRQAMQDAVITTKQKDPYRPFYVLVIAALIGTTIPYITISFAFSVFFLISTGMLINSRSKHGAKVSKKFLCGLLCVLLLSTASGCGPILADLDPEMIALCQENGACKVGTSFGYSIAGITIKKASVKEAENNGNIEERIATEIGKGYGLVSFTKIVVYGS